MKLEKPTDARRFATGGPVRHAKRLGLAVLACCAVPLASVQAEPTSTITAVLDYAKIIEVPEAARTIILGNPTVADVVMTGKNKAVVTAKGFGATNLIMLDSKGAVLSESLLRVEKSYRKKVVVRRGSDQYTYVCDPQCEAVVELGDVQSHMASTIGSINTRASMAKSR